ncbi:MAG: RNA polymerase sigma factor [Clostridia bacterium]|nr:RNA polymerase sigma factor [Clostridia bacterium]
MDIQSRQADTMSDEQIVDLYWQRNEQAFKETDIKYKNYLLSVAMNIVHDMSDSEECLNDTYIGAWNAIPPARPVALQAFLGAIMRRTAIDRFRKNNRQKRVASEFTVSLSELEDFIADDRDLSAEIEAKELGKIISNYVSSLPDRQMYIFVSRYYFAEPFANICAELGCSISTAKREIKIVKKGLKEKLESEGFIV